MPTQAARVIAVSAPQHAIGTSASARVTDSAEKLRRVTVRTMGRSSCAACAAGRGCGAGLFSRLLPAPPQQFVLHSSLSLAAGDQVLLQATQADVDRMAWIWYGLPLLWMLALAALTQWTLSLLQWGQRPWQDLAVLLALLAGLASGWWLAARLSARSSARVSIVGRCQTQQATATTAIEDGVADTNITTSIRPSK